MATIGLKMKLRKLSISRGSIFMDAVHFSDPFDIIFCRNVMIYFDKTTQGNIVNKFYGCLKEGGYLFVGRSESLTGLNHQYKYVEPSVYRK